VCVSARHFYPKKPVNCDSWNWFLLLLERLFCCLLSSKLCTFWKFSVPDQIVGWPRSRKNLVAEGGHTLPLSPCQLGQLGYFSLQPARRLNIAPPAELRFHREECCCWDSLVSTFPARLFQSFFFSDQARHIRPILNQAFVSELGNILGVSLFIKAGKSSLSRTVRSPILFSDARKTMRRRHLGTFCFQVIKSMQFWCMW